MFRFIYLFYFFRRISAYSFSFARSSVSIFFVFLLLLLLMCGKMNFGFMKCINLCNLFRFECLEYGKSY